MGVAHSAKGTCLYFDASGSQPITPGIPPASDTPTPSPAIAIGQVRSITGPTVKPKVVDVTTHDTPGWWARKLTVLIEPGDISFEVNWNIMDPTHDFTNTTQSMWAALVGGTGSVAPLQRASLMMHFPYSMGDMSFYGYVAQHEFSVPVDNVLACKIQFAITDAITVGKPAAGSPYSCTTTTT